MKHIICEKCGSEMIDLSKGPYITATCPSCGWGWATCDGSLEPEPKKPIRIDIAPSQYTAAKARFLSQLVFGNALEAKKALTDGRTIFVDSPKTVETMKSNGIVFAEQGKRMMNDAESENDSKAHR